MIDRFDKLGGIVCLFQIYFFYMAFHNLLGHITTFARYICTYTNHYALHCPDLVTGKRSHPVFPVLPHGGTGSLGLQKNYWCVEQYIQAGKAELFDDDSAYHKIINATSPFEMKKEGSNLKNYGSCEMVENQRKNTTERKNSGATNNNGVDLSPPPGLKTLETHVS